MSAIRRARRHDDTEPPRDEADPSGARAEPTDEQAMAFFRFTKLDSIVRARGERLYAAVATGAFCDCMLRIVARQGDEFLSVEVDALDVTSLPLLPRQNDLEFLKRLASEARVLHEVATAPPRARTRFLSEIASVDWFGVTDDRRIGLDGYQFSGALSEGKGRKHRFSGWSPRGEASPHFRFLRVLHELASTSVQGWCTLAALDALQPYAGLGEVFRNFGGRPCHLRLSGFVEGEPAGAAVLEKLRASPARAPVVLDLGEARGPKELLEVALSWARSTPNVRVVLPRRWTDDGSLGIPAERVFRDVSTALGHGR